MKVQPGQKPANLRRAVELIEKAASAGASVVVLPEAMPLGWTDPSAKTDADEIPEGKGWYRAVYVDDAPVGFVMLSWDVVPQPPRIIGPWFLWKLLIDERHQHRGYGSEVVTLVAQVVRDNGGTELLTSCVQAADGPEAFYRRLGFKPTGDSDENGEIILALKLAAAADRR